MFHTIQPNGAPQLWLASTEHLFAPRKLEAPPNEGYPSFSASRRIYFASTEPTGQGYVYRMKEDGTQLEKVSPLPVLEASEVSPTERFVMVRRTLNKDENWWEIEALSVSGEPATPICSGWCHANWANDGKYMYVDWLASKGSSEYKTYVLPIVRGTELPKLPSKGFQSEAELHKSAVQVIDTAIHPGPSSSSYAYSRQTAHSNVYRIPLR